VGKLDRTDDVVGVTLHQHYVCALNGNVRAGTNGKADIGLSEGRCVIDAITNHPDFPALRLQLLDLACFLTWQDIGKHELKAKILGNTLCGAEVVPGKHRDLDSALAQFGDRGLLDQLGVTRYAMYVMDYGAPVGWRLALKHPERVTGLIVQNGNAYDEGLKEFWNPIKAYWADGSDAHRQALMGLFTLETTKFQYTDGVADVSRVSPDNWVHDQALLDRPGNNDIQLDIFYDYRTNLPLYPAVQAYFREHRPPTLIVWGKNDTIFPADGAHPYKRDLPEVEFHLIDTGHFALEDKADEMVPLIRDFLDRTQGNVR
jgi:hypothetical protein